ncbi:MAG TPA: MoaD/ThiS family protein [Candidatus Methylomirabilis sp.]|nr:MoaD/ThiS family protein [Candidatus Methylomirabilis sp.]HSD51770.1 MoaD/ThiS family protein [Candidatus Methylomirabilis sp.]
MAVVTFLGDMRKAAGRATVDVKGDSVKALLAALGDAVSPAFASLLLRDGALQPDVEVLINGRNIEFLQMLDTPLGSADQVTVFYSGVRGFPGG